MIRKRFEPLPYLNMLDFGESEHRAAIIGSWSRTSVNESKRFL